MNPDHTKRIKSLVEETLLKLQIPGEVEVLEHEEFPQFVIRSREAGILIGEGGQNLEALSHIVKKIAYKILEPETKEGIFFSLDVNDYLASKVEELKNMAKMNAQKVVYFKKAVEMDPMPANERRIIHTFLTEHPNITTESVGEGENRRVIIKPYEI